VPWGYRGPTFSATGPALAAAGRPEQLVSLTRAFDKALHQNVDWPLALYRRVAGVYWGMTRRLIGVMGERGHHWVSVGQFEAGEAKVRSIWREDITLRTLLLALELRGKSCLDLGCNDGFWSYRLGRFGVKNVVGIEGEPQPVRYAQVLKVMYGFPDFEFRQGDVLDFVLRENQRDFDLVLLLSIIYHLPEQTDWSAFFGRLGAHNRYALVIDSRWFDDDDYYHDKTGYQAMLHTPTGVLKKWRPMRAEVAGHLHAAGYRKVVDLDPSVFIRDKRAALGDGDPYSLGNACDYVTGNRSLMVAYRNAADAPEWTGCMKVREL
jgi:SAM-dependent methyltransferase